MKIEESVENRNNFIIKKGANLFMYQNGKRIEGYLKDRQHKRIMKDKYAEVRGYNSYKNIPQEEAIKYWHYNKWHMNTKFAKDITNSRMRTDLREMLNTIMDAIEDVYEDIDPTPSSSSFHHKMHDSWWENW